MKSLLSLAASVTLLRNSKFNTLGLGQGDVMLIVLTDHKNVGQASCELPIERVLYVNNLEATNVTLAMSDDAHTANVPSSCNHARIPDLEFNDISRFACCQIQTDCIIYFNKWIGISDRPSVVSNHVRNTLGAQLNLLNFAQFVCGFCLGDAMNGEATLHIIDEAEVFTSLVDGDDIHEAGGVSRISSDLAINLYEALHKNALHFVPCEGILQTVSQEYD